MEKFKRGWVTLLLLWAGGLAVLGLFHLLGRGMGFRIGPVGEDFNWVFFLRRDFDYPAQKAFWALDARNPLAPWWYLLAKPLIVDTAYGIYAVRKLVDLGCGLSVYALVRTLGGAGAKPLALSAGALTLLWSISQMVGQINWTMIVALSFSLLTITAYVRFLDSNRLAWGWFLLSLLLFQIAIGTYTLQASACLAIAGLALVRHRVSLRTAVFDLAPFLLVLALFLLTWSTTGNLPEQAPAWGVASFGKIFRSLLFFVWDSVYLETVQEFWRFQPADFGLAVLASVGLGLAFGHWCQTSPADQPLANQLLLIVAALIAGTVGLEMFSPLWLPGTRAPMVQQAVMPLLFTLAVHRFAGRAARALFAIAFTVVAFLGFAHNARLSRFYADVAKVATSLKAAVPTITKPTTFVLLRPPIGISPYNSDIFVKGLYNSPDVNLKIAWPGPIPAQWDDYHDLIFGSDSAGLYAENSLGNPRFQLRSPASWIPYENVVLLRDTPQGFRRTFTLNKEDVVGWRVLFQRSAPLNLNSTTIQAIPLRTGNWKLQSSARLDPESLALIGTPESPVSLAEHPVQLLPNAEYVITFEARANGDPKGLYADLYNGNAYDNHAQDYDLVGLGPDFKSFRFVIPAGPAPPPNAFLRVVNPNLVPVFIRFVHFARLQ